MTKIKPVISSERYHLEIEQISLFNKTKTYWKPIGCDSSTLEEVKLWLNANFNIYINNPHVKYRIMKETFWKSSLNIVEEGNRK
jgi:hypothetical protein